MPRYTVLSSLFAVVFATLGTSCSDSDSTDGSSGNTTDAGSATSDGGKDDGAQDGGSICVAQTDCPKLQACSKKVLNCVPGRLVFLSSEMYDFKLESLEKADALCQALGDKALPGRTWKAWLSTRETSAADRLTRSTLPYYSAEGLRVARDWNALVNAANEPLEAPIDVDETGARHQGVVSVWTGTRANGTSADDTCGDWAGDGEGLQGTVGAVGATNGSWTDTGTDPCDDVTSSNYIYCFEEGE